MKNLEDVALKAFKAIFEAGATVERARIVGEKLLISMVRPRLQSLDWNERA